MILNLLTSVILFLSVWPFFIVLNILNFKKPENSIEQHLRGRPARRRIGRKNEDVIKSIIGIFIFYVILCGALYAMPYLSYLIHQNIIVFIVAILIGFGVYFVTPYNRLIHAYATTGQISVVHLCCSLSSFLLFAGFFHKTYMDLTHAGLSVAMVFGAMLMTSGAQE